MNKHFPPGHMIIPYKLKVLPTITYAKMKKSDRDYLRYMCSMLWGHIKANKDLNPEQYGLYNWFVNSDQKKLPKPSKKSNLNRKYNTWSTFIQGVEHNFLYDQTEDYSLKQLEHIVEAVNMAVEYFTTTWQDFEPQYQACYVKLLKI